MKQPEQPEPTRAVDDGEAPEEFILASEILPVMRDVLQINITLIKRHQERLSSLEREVADTRMAGSVAAAIVFLVVVIFLAILVTRW